MKYLIDFVILAVIYWLYYRKKWLKEEKDKMFIRTLMYIYLSFVFYFTLMPFIASLPHLFDHPYIPMNLNPFDDFINGYGDYNRQIFLNVLMTIPFGILYPMCHDGQNTTLGKTVSVCFLMSLAIEMIQPLLAGNRSSDVTDLITNTFGALVGYAIYHYCGKVLGWIYRNMRRS